MHIRPEIYRYKDEVPASMDPFLVNGPQSRLGEGCEQVKGLLLRGVQSTKTLFWPPKMLLVSPRLAFGSSVLAWMLPRSLVGQDRG